MHAERQFPAFPKYRYMKLRKEKDERNGMSFSEPFTQHLLRLRNPQS